MISSRIPVELWQSNQCGWKERATFLREFMNMVGMDGTYVSTVFT